MGHTPHKHLTTPWVANGAYVFAGSDCIAICDTDNADEATYEAKARLMAAAPALIAALETIAEMGNKTLIAPSMGEDCDHAHQVGANKAFGQAADIATRALTAAQGASADTGER